MAAEYTDWKRMEDLFNLIRKPIPWDYAQRFLKDHGEVLTKEQVVKITNIRARLLVKELELRKEYEAKVSEIDVEGAKEIGKVMSMSTK